MDNTEQMKALYAAIAEWQGLVHNPAYDSTNPHFRSKFASLPSVRNALLPAASQCRLAIVQVPTSKVGEDGSIWAGVQTYVYHAEGGELFLGACLFPVSKEDAFGVAGAITYARRYSLQALAGVAADEDLDGADVAYVPGEAPQQAQAPRSPAPAPSQPAPARSAPAASGTGVVPMGKHSGKPWGDVPIDYLLWGAEKASNAAMREGCQQELKLREEGEAELGQQFEAASADDFDGAQVPF